MQASVHINDNWNLVGELPRLDSDEAEDQNKEKAKNNNETTSSIYVQTNPKSVLGLDFTLFTRLETELYG